MTNADRIRAMRDEKEERTMNNNFSTVVVPWSWLEKFSEGKTYPYLSSFLSEAKEAYEAEMKNLYKDFCSYGVCKQEVQADGRRKDAWEPNETDLKAMLDAGHETFVRVFSQDAKMDQEV